MQLLINDIKKFFFVFLVAIVISLAFFVPKETSSAYNNLYFSIFLLLTFLFFRIKKKKNYFDFDSIFVLMYAIVTFVFPVFMFTTKAPFAEFFNLKYNVNFVSKGMYISLLGISGYYLGSLIKQRPIKPPEKYSSINTNFLILMGIIFAILFYLVGGVQYYQSIYLKNVEAPSGPVIQVIALLQAFAITAIATEAYNRQLTQEKKYNKFFLVTIICISILFLYSGNRTTASLLLLPLLFWYIKESRPLNFLKFSVLIFVGIILMWIIQQTRTGSQVTLSEGVSVIKDLTIVNRNTYIGIEYVNNYGYTYGRTMVNGVIGIIPTMERFLTLFFGLDISKFGSAELFTDYTFHNNSSNRFGLGTNIVIDIFLSFGYLGTFFLMFFLGYFVSKAFSRANSLHYYYYIIYSVLIANSVFLVRSNFTYPLRLLIWSLIIANLNKSLMMRIGHFFTVRT